MNSIRKSLFSSLLITALLALATTGCSTKLDSAGPYANDRALYDADLTIMTSYDTMHTFVSWEYQNRAALAQWPEVKTAADTVRSNGPQWIQSAINLREAYVANPTGQNRDNLTKAIGVLRGALFEAAKYMGAHSPTAPATGPPG